MFDTLDMVDGYRVFSMNLSIYSQPSVYILCNVVQKWCFTKEKILPIATYHSFNGVCPPCLELKSCGESPSSSGLFEPPIQVVHEAHIDMDDMAQRQKKLTCGLDCFLKRIVTAASCVA